MDKKNLLIKFNLYLSLVFLVETALCTDYQFEACEPQNCGIGPNISYPFWIHDRQESYCGYPGFDLVCKENMPILRISEDDYVIHQIFYKNQSLLVSNAAVKANSCSLPIHNVTIEKTNLLEFGPSQSNISLFSNCVFNSTKEYTNQTVGCSSDDADHRSVVLFDQDPRLNYLKNSSVCNSSVVIPVRREADTSIRTITHTKYVELLMEGFVLKWNVNNCSRCEDSGGRCGYKSNESIFQCFCPDRPHSGRCHGKKKIAAKVGIGFGAGIIGISIALLTIYICLRVKRRSTSSVISKNISSDPSSKSDHERGSMYFGVHMFTHSELEEATENFNPTKELGDGGFGTVYLGKLRDGRLVAVKRLYEQNYKRAEQFLNEVEILTRLHHQNLVTLYGCTSRRSHELLLVYEYMPNGTVADHLHGDRAKPGSLSWPTRLKIAIETASALAYLHASDVIHRDVKTNNILLDNNFHVKVADFGLSRLFPTGVTHVSTAPQGTPGYVDPEYHQCYHLTDKSDVYSFGVVLIELISSLPAVDISRHRHEINLANRAINKIQSRSFHELVDPSLGFEETYAVKRMITLVAELAFRCLQSVREMRPSMKEVLEALKGIESDDYREVKKELDNGEDDVGLLKNIHPPPSPDTVTAKWVSRSSTPNTSNLIFKVGSKSMS